MSCMKEKLIGDVDDAFNKLWPELQYRKNLTIADLKSKLGIESYCEDDWQTCVYDSHEPGKTVDDLTLWFTIQSIMTGEL